MARRVMVWVTGLVLALASGCSHGPVRNPWREVQAPAPAAQGGVAQVFGGHAGGCVRGAVSLTPDGPGFQLMRLSRARFYGHPNLVSYIQELGRAVQQARLGTLLIGDLGQARGGPTLSAHRSHQSGLDVDIWFWRPGIAQAKACNGARSLTLEEREVLPSPSFVRADRLDVDRERWTRADARVLKLAAAHEEVERIFVNAAIKRELCRTVPAGPGREWLRKLRPWWGHDDHFHVRLRCPPGSAGEHCKAQEPIEPGDGCDEKLDWWFSTEALEQAKKPPSSEPPKMPELPAQCADVLKL